MAQTRFGAGATRGAKTLLGKTPGGPLRASCGAVLRQTHRGVPEQAARLHELQRIQGYLLLVLKLFPDRRQPEE